MAGQAIELLKEQLEKGRELERRSPEFVGKRRAWATATAESLRRNLDSDSPLLASFVEAGGKYGNWSHSADGQRVRNTGQRNYEVLAKSALGERTRRERASADALSEQLQFLESAIEILEKAPPETVSMSWSLEHYNLICYPESADYEIFRDKSGQASFEYERLFEYTEGEVESRYEGNLASLAELPALVVAETPTNPKSRTPAFLSRIGDVRKRGGRVDFHYRHLNGGATSKDVFDSDLFDFDNFERSRTHWAVKGGDLLYKFFKLTERRAVSDKPKFFNVDWPLPESDHIAVMMPFSPKFDPVCEVIKKACSELGRRAVRVDDIYTSNKIIDDVFSTIVQGRLTVCDLTGRNPNVLYEAGLAHARGRDVILLTQNEKDVPFDLAQIRYIKYLDNGEGREKLLRDLKESIAACLKED